jgi:HSP20 family protein
MQTIIHEPSARSRLSSAETKPAVSFARPHYDCENQEGALKLVVYLPGVDAAGVNIEAQSPDLVVTAHKPRPVRVNWQALQLETASRDYRLKLRLGRGFDFGAMQAELGGGVLTVTVPKRTGAVLHARAA